MLYEKPTVSILETTATDNNVYKINQLNLDAALNAGYGIVTLPQNCGKLTNTQALAFLRAGVVRGRIFSER